MPSKAQGPALLAPAAAVVRPQCRHSAERRGGRQRALVPGADLL